MLAQTRAARRNFLRRDPTRREAILLRIVTFDRESRRNFSMTGGNLVSFTDSRVSLKTKGVTRTVSLRKSQSDPVRMVSRVTIKELLNPICAFDHNIVDTSLAATPIGCACLMLNPLPVNSLRPKIGGM